MYPNDKYGDIDREDAKHEDENRMGVIIEIMMGSRLLDMLVHDHG